MKRLIYMSTFNNKGFGIVGIFILVVILGLVGAAGWFVYDRQYNSKDSNVSREKINKKDNNITQKNCLVSSDLKQFGDDLAFPSENINITQAIYFKANSSEYDAMPIGYFDNFKQLNMDADNKKWVIEFSSEIGFIKDKVTKKQLYEERTKKIMNDLQSKSLISNSRIIIKEPVFIEFKNTNDESSLVDISIMSNLISDCN